MPLHGKISDCETSQSGKGKANRKGYREICDQLKINSSPAPVVNREH